MLNKTTLAHFTGSETFTKYGSAVLTEGARYVAENGGQGKNSAFWLLDVILSHRAQISKNEEFLTCKLTSKGGGKALFTIDDGNGNILAKQLIPFTDFDFESVGPEFTLWMVQKTILLPSEY